MPSRDVVVVGASAGGVEALRTVVGGLPAGFPATVLVVLHVPRTGPDALGGILDRAGPLPSRTATDGEPLTPGTVRVATPDRHLVLARAQDGALTVGLTGGPSENGHRPSVDALFRSAAAAAGGRVVAVVLSGTLDDGAAGVVAVSRAGGTTVVQDPADALHRGMPESALAAVTADHVLPAADIPALLDRLVRQEPAPPAAEPAPGSDDAPVRPSGYSCPVCAGPLWEQDDGPLLRFRCRVGHAWSVESLLAEQSTAMDGALWMALRGLEERAALHSELGRRALVTGQHFAELRFAERAAESSGAARVIRDLLTGRAAAGEPAPEEPAPEEPPTVDRPDDEDTAQ